MQHAMPRRISFDAFDEENFPRPHPSGFEQVVDSAMTRRRFLGGSIAFGTAAFVTGATFPSPLSAIGVGRLGFEQIAANTLDTVTVPPGYRWHVVVKWGEPLWSDAPELDQETRGTGASQERAFGGNNDGMFLYHDGDRTVLAVNNEYIDHSIIHGNRESEAPENADDVRKSKAAHGVSIVEIALADGRWAIVKDSPYNRRITADTPMKITGPARGHDLMKTAADPDGTTTLGT
jgi:uncharacterized protein